MNHIFIGLLLIFFDFTFNYGNHTIGLIPDFIGYYFIVKGLEELTYESEQFLKARPFAIGIGVYSAILYVIALSGIMVQMEWFGLVLSAIETAAKLYIFYLIMRGVREIETNRSVELNGEKLQSVWKILLISEISVYVTLLIPIVRVIFIIFCFIMLIIFLVQFYKTKNLYEELSLLNQ